MSHFCDSTIIFDESLTDSERESLKNSMRYHVKYGSTGNNHKKMQNYKYITHLVQPTDTLQGLALRYEVTMEQIKRANKLWSSDNLSLRSRNNVSIPIVMDETIIESPIYSSSNTSSLNGSPKECEFNNRSHCSITANNSSLESDDIPLDDEYCSTSRVENNQTDRHSNESKLRNGFKMATLLVSSHESNDLNNYNNSEEVDDESAADFLIRIDSSIAKSKDKVKVMQQNRMSGTHSDDDLFRINHSTNKCGLRRHHSSTSRPHSANSSSSLNDIQTDLSQPIVVMTHGRKVKSSLKRLEKTQDEIFEL